MTKMDSNLVVQICYMFLNPIIKINKSNDNNNNNKKVINFSNKQFNTTTRINSVLMCVYIYTIKKNWPSQRQNE